MKKAFLLLAVLFFTTSTVLAQNQKTFTKSLQDKTYVFEVVTNMSEDSTAKYGHNIYDVVNYSVSDSNGLLGSGNLELPKKYDGKAVRIVNAEVTQSGIIILKSHLGFIFRFKLNNDFVAEKI